MVTGLAEPNFRGTMVFTTAINQFYATHTHTPSQWTLLIGFGLISYMLPIKSQSSIDFKAVLALPVITNMLQMWLKQTA